MFTDEIFQLIPKEIWVEIAKKYLHVSAYGRLKQTCHSFRSLFDWRIDCIVIDRQTERIEKEEDGSVVEKFLNISYVTTDDTTISYKNGKKHSIDGLPSVSSYGKWIWHHRGKLHRGGGLPAIIKANGQQEWYQRGKAHRIGGPAVIMPSGEQKWYRYGKLHRAGDDPAVVTDYGMTMWYRNGKFHRDGDKPAVMGNDTNIWYRNGKTHRDGDYPAVISIYGVKKWYKNGKLSRIFFASSTYPPSPDTSKEGAIKQFFLSCLMHDFIVLLFALFIYYIIYTLLTPFTSIYEFLLPFASSNTRLSFLANLLFLNFYRFANLPYDLNRIYLRYVVRFFAVMYEAEKYRRRWNS